MVATVAFIDDDVMLLDGLALWAARSPSVSSYGRYGTVDQYLNGEPAALVVLDVHLGDSSDPSANVSRLVRSGAAVLLFSSAPNPRIVIDTLKAGAAGFVEKAGGFAALDEAIATVFAGKEYLSQVMAFAISRDATPDRPRLSGKEVAVLGEYASGLTMATVARRLGISESTALTHLRRVKQKYRVVGREASTKYDLMQRWNEDRHSFE